MRLQIGLNRKFGFPSRMLCSVMTAWYLWLNVSNTPLVYHIPKVNSRASFCTGFFSSVFWLNGWHYHPSCYASQKLKYPSGCPSLVYPPNTIHYSLSNLLICFLKPSPWPTWPSSPALSSSRSFFLHTTATEIFQTVNWVRSPIAHLFKIRYWISFYARKKWSHSFSLQMS